MRCHVNFVYAVLYVLYVYVMLNYIVVEGSKLGID